MRKQTKSYATIASAKRKAKADSRKLKLDEVISIVSEMSEKKLEAMLLILDPPAADDFELSEQDKLEVNERTARYESGKDKGIPAAEVARQAREALKKLKRK